MSSLIEKLTENEYIYGQGVYYAGAIRAIKKSPDELQGLWEAVTNSFESIAENKQNHCKQTEKEIKAQTYQNISTV